MEETKNNSWWILAIILVIALGIGVYLYMRPTTEPAKENTKEAPSNDPEPKTSAQNQTPTTSMGNSNISEPPKNVKLPNASLENLSMPISKIPSSKTGAGMILQAILREGGESVVIDGKVGPKTKAAAKNFAESRNVAYSDQLTVYYLFKLLDSTKYPNVEYLLHRQAKNFK